MRRRKHKREGEVRTWADLTKLTKASFVPTSYYHKLLGDLQDLRQGTENVMEYYHELLSLMRKIGTKGGEEATKARFIHGHNINLKRVVEPNRVLSLDLLLTYAKAIESLSKDSATSRAREETTQSQGIVETNKLGSTMTRRATSHPKGQRINCLGYQGYGHVAKVFPNLRRKENDNNEDISSGGEHKENEELEEAASPSPKSAITSDEELSQDDKSLVAIKPSREEPNEQRSNVFHMKCKVKDKTCVVIIDGGCPTNAVSDQLVTRVGIF